MAPSATTTIEQQYTPISIKPISNFENSVAEVEGPSSKEYGKQLIGEALRARIQDIDGDTCDAGEEDTFFVADLGEVYRQHLRWKLNLRRVKPHYGKHF